MIIDEKKLIKSGLNPDMYFILYALYHQLDDLVEYLEGFKIYNLIIEKLEKGAFIKIIGTSGDYKKDLIFRNKTLSLLDEKRTKAEDWYEEWRNLFPPGVNRTGYYYRGNKQEVLKKLNTFTRKYPKITQEQIMEATKRYISRCKSNKGFMMLAHYFINKEGVGSTLLTEIENLDSPSNTGKRVTAL